MLMPTPCNPVAMTNPCYEQAALSWRQFVLYACPWKTAKIATTTAAAASGGRISNITAMPKRMAEAACHVQFRKRSADG
jgi:hypothetical protein